MNLSNLILQFKLRFDAIVNYLSDVAIVARLAISADVMTGLADSKSTFDDSYKPYTNPNEQNSGVTSDMNKAYIYSFTYCENLNTSIKTNPMVVLTGKDRLNLDIAEDRVRRNHVGVYNVAPAVISIIQYHLRMDFIAFDPTNPFKRGKPKDVHSIGIKVAYVKTGDPAPKPEDYKQLTPEKQTEFELLFTADQLGLTLYIIGFYLNNRNEAGPESIPYSIAII